MASEQEDPSVLSALRPFGDERDGDLDRMRAVPLPMLPDPVLPGRADDAIRRAAQPG